MKTGMSVRIKCNMKLFTAFLLMLLLAASPACAGERKPFKPSPKDKCPVCGMFVAKYSDFAARITFKDGSYAYFDGVKDMLKYYLEVGRFNRAKKRSDIDSIQVTDYYALTPIDGESAWYVDGSDVLGPMGKEFIAFGKEMDALEFKKDHKGKRIFRLKEIDKSVIRRLD